jgi:hypothetical protein
MVNLLKKELFSLVKEFDRHPTVCATYEKGSNSLTIVTD